MNKKLRFFIIILAILFVICSGFRPARVDANGNTNLISLGYVMDSIDNYLFGDPYHVEIKVDEELAEKVTDENEIAREKILKAKEVRKDFKSKANEDGFMPAFFMYYDKENDKIQDESIMLRYDITAQELVKSYIVMHSEKFGYELSNYPSIIAEEDMFTLTLNFSSEITFMTEKEENYFFDCLEMMINEYLPEVDNLYVSIRGKYEYDSNNKFIAYDENLMK